MGRNIRVKETKKVCLERYGSRKFKNPREEYIYSEDPVTLRELAERWKHKKKCSYPNLACKSKDENWRFLRKKFWDDCFKKRDEEFRNQVVNRDVAELVDATRRHKQLGMTMQGIFHSSIKKEDGKTFLVRHDGEEVPLKAGDVIRAGKEGFEIERKALGYTDQVIQVSFAQDVMEQVFDIVCKYIDDPSVVRNIQADFSMIKKKHQDKLEEYKP